MAEGGKDRQLPGLELSYTQLFFINYAQVAAQVPGRPAAGPPGNQSGASTMGCFLGCGERASQAEPELTSLERLLEEKDGRGLEPRGFGWSWGSLPRTQEGAARDRGTRLAHA